jgi:hypothetical protein
MSNNKEMYRLLKREGEREISPRDMTMLKKKYDLWKLLHQGEFNCPHCIFNHHDCTDANKHYDVILGGGYYCLAFLQEGCYVK